MKKPCQKRGFFYRAWDQVHMSFPLQSLSVLLVDLAPMHLNSAAPKFSEKGLREGKPFRHLGF